MDAKKLSSFVFSFKVIDTVIQAVYTNGKIGLYTGYSSLSEKEKTNHLSTNEPPRGKTNNVVSEQVRHKPTCTSTEKS